MRGLGIALGLALVWGSLGLGLEAARRVLFVSEPVVLWTVPGEGDVVFTYSGVPVSPVAGRKSPEGDRIRWELDLGGGPGVWLACTDLACFAFLRVPDEVGIVEVRAAPGAALRCAGQAVVADASGWAFFVVPPGDHGLQADLGRDSLVRSLTLRSGERVTVALALASAAVSTPVAPPGSTLTLFLSVLPPRDLPTLDPRFELPGGWEVTPTSGVYDPLRAGELAVRSWRLTIPAGAEAGEYTVYVAFPDLDFTAQASLAVAYRLPPEVVVCHWDVTADWLDLTLPCELTYERLLWAASFVGRELPFTGRVFSQAEFQELASRWGQP